MAIPDIAGVALGLRVYAVPSDFLSFGEESKVLLANWRKMMIRRNYLTAIATLALMAGAQLVSMPAYATDQSQQRQEARETKQTGREDAREQKVECKAGDEDTRAECRQEKRDTKQDTRDTARDTKRQ